MWAAEERRGRRAARGSRARTEWAVTPGRDGGRRRGLAGPACQRRTASARGPGCRSRGGCRRRQNRGRSRGGCGRRQNLGGVGPVLRAEASRSRPVPEPEASAGAPAGTVTGAGPGTCRGEGARGWIGRVFPGVAGARCRWWARWPPPSPGVPRTGPGGICGAASRARTWTTPSSPPNSPSSPWPAPPSPPPSACWSRSSWPDDGGHGQARGAPQISTARPSRPRITKFGLRVGSVARVRVGACSRRAVIEAASSMRASGAPMQ